MDRGQLETIFWLRWRLTLNQWRRGGGLETLVGVFLIVAAVIAGGAGCITGLIGGAMALGPASPREVLAVWLGLTAGFLLLWFVGFLNELQRSETIDVARLLHLPIAPWKVFLVNYAASHLTLTIVFIGLTMLGLAVGGALARGPVMLLVAPLALAYVGMISAWTYCGRGWLAGLMVNPRRRRSVIMVVMAAVAVALNVAVIVVIKRGFDARQKPKPATRAEEISQYAAKQAANERTIRQLISAQRYVPLAWLPGGAYAAAEGRTGPAVWATIGCLALGAAGLHRAYRGTVRFYRGETDARAGGETGLTAPRAAGQSRWLERKLPGVPGPAAVVALAAVRSHGRAAEVRMGFVGFVSTAALFGTIAAFAPQLHLPPSARWFAPAVVAVFSLMMTASLLMNQFGLDRHGFRALVLSPMCRHHILVGKNLAALLFCAPATLVLAAVGWLALRLSAAEVATALLQLGGMLVLACAAGNLVSIIAPQRIDLGALKANKISARATLINLGLQLLFPVLLAPILLVPLATWAWEQSGGDRADVAGLLAAAVLLALATVVYRRTLRPLGRLLQRRERRILEVVTAQVE